MNYTTIFQNITYLDNAGNDREEEVSLEFSPHGLTDKGTFILYESPSDAEEQLMTTTRRTGLSSIASKILPLKSIAGARSKRLSNL